MVPEYVHNYGLCPKQPDYCDPSEKASLPFRGLRQTMYHMIAGRRHGATDINSKAQLCEAYEAHLPEHKPLPGRKTVEYNEEVCFLSRYDNYLSQSNTSWDQTLAPCPSMLAQRL